MRDIIKAIICAASLFLVGVLCSGCSCEDNAQGSTVSTDSNPGIRNFCMTYGLNSTEIELDIDDQVEFVNWISNYSLQEINQENSVYQDTLYGGSIFSLDFSDRNIDYQWRFSENIFVKIETQNGDIRKSFYRADDNVLDKLESFNDLGDKL